MKVKRTLIPSSGKEDTIVTTVAYKVVTYKDRILVQGLADRLFSIPNRHNGFMFHCPSNSKAIEGLLL